MVRRLPIWEFASKSPRIHTAGGQKYVEKLRARPPLSSGNSLPLALDEFAYYYAYAYSSGSRMATSIRLDPALEQRLDHLAAQTGRTKSYYLRELVAMGLDDLEDYYLAASTVERVRKGKEKVYSSAQVRKDLGLDG